MTEKLRKPTPESEMLRRLVRKLDEYDLDGDCAKIIQEAKSLLVHYKEYSGAHPDKLSDEMIAKVMSATGSLRKIAKELNLSHEVVRKYRQRPRVDR